MENEQFLELQLEFTENMQMIRTWDMWIWNFNADPNLTKTWVVGECVPSELLYFRNETHCFMVSQYSQGTLLNSSFLFFFLCFLSFSDNFSHTSSRLHKKVYSLTQHLHLGLHRSKIKKKKNFPKGFVVDYLLVKSINRLAIASIIVSIEALVSCITFRRPLHLSTLPRSSKMISSSL